MEGMTKKEISAGVVHKVPADLRKVLTSSPAARAAWEDITPLARNEWICWIVSYIGGPYSFLSFPASVSYLAWILACAGMTIEMVRPVAPYVWLASAGG